MRPSRGLVWGGTAWACLGVLASIDPAWRWAWALAGGALALVAVVDWGFARRDPGIACARSVEKALPLDERSEVVLTLRLAEGRRSRIVEIFDHHPVSMDAEGVPAKAKLSPGVDVPVPYRVRPRERGEHAFGTVDVRGVSPLRLWEPQWKLGVSSRVRVYPNFRKATRYALLAVDYRASRFGVRVRPRRGEGTELRQLREYREGDAIRQIDWKATARLRRPISREYQAERDQQVVFLLDCGRNMRSIDDGASHFDHALNALLVLGYVALRQGDAVGLLSFGGETRWLSPVKGPSAIHALMEAVYDLETVPDASDFASATSDLMARQRRRSLVVMISNLRDGEGTEVASSLQVLRRRHLVLLGSLREAALDRALEGPVEKLDDALRIGALHHYLEARRKAHESFDRRGVSVLDVLPSRLPLALVNRYLEMKRSGAL